MSKIIEVPAFSFAPLFNQSIPEEVLNAPPKQRAPGANALPFIEAFFKPAEDDVKAGKGPAALFVPKAFWTARDGVKAENVSGAYQVAKMREVFNKFRNETKQVTTKEVREAGTPKANKNGKMVTMPGKVVTPEVSTNEARGGFVLYSMERTGKEKDQAEITKGQPGVQFWLNWVAPAK